MRLRLINDKEGFGGNCEVMRHESQERWTGEHDRKEVRNDFLCPVAPRIDSYHLWIAMRECARALNQKFASQVGGNFAG